MNYKSVTAAVVQNAVELARRALVQGSGNYYCAPQNPEQINQDVAAEIQRILAKRGIAVSQQ